METPPSADFYTNVYIHSSHFSFLNFHLFLSFLKIVSIRLGIMTEIAIMARLHRGGDRTKETGSKRFYYEEGHFCPTWSKKVFGKHFNSLEYDRYQPF